MRKRLAKQGIPEPILARWEKRFGGRLLPLQYRAVEEYRLLEGESLLISAPTSSGKTFCGEMALVRAVQQRKKALFLVPLKAVAEEKYRHFRACYGDLGLKIAIATRDHQENDGHIEKGHFDIAVMVYEKFNSLLLGNFDIMAQIGTVIVDELQMMEDKSRGAQLELALTKLLFSDYNPQLVALSAVLGEATELAQWLGCRLLLEKMRPVELQRGIASEGRFYFRCHSWGELGEDACREGDDVSLTLFENIKDAISLGRPVLVFLKSRRETLAAAERFAEFIGREPRPDNEKFLDEKLADEEESSLLANLRSLFAVGVAFHNADLTAHQRLAVEEGYRSGLINVVFATTTLSTGINLPAATVFIEAQKYRSQGYTGRPGLEPLSWAEYESMSGRAGRVGLMEEEGGSGRAVLFASGELEKSILWEYYIDKQPARITSQLPGRDMADILVDLFSSGLVGHSADVEKLLQRSYYVVCNGHINNKISDICEVLLDGGFMGHEGNRMVATPLGKAVAKSGLTVAGANYLLKREPFREPVDDERLMYYILHSPEGKGIYLPAGHRDRLRGSYRLFAEEAEAGPLLRDMAAMQRELNPDEISRLELVFLMKDWMGGMTALDIESDYHLHAGLMENLGYQVGWLLVSAASIIRARDRFSPLPGRLDDLGFSARYGLPGSLRRLHRDFGGLLFRREWMALYGHDIIDRRKFLREGCSILAGIISSEERLKKIEKRIRKIKEADMPANGNLVFGSAVWPGSIEIDGTPIRERFRVHIDGHPINLTGKSFKYLLRLVWSRLTQDNGWLYKEDLEKGFNQARYLYRLRQEIGRDFLPDWPLYENNRSGYYRLAAQRDGLKVNIDALQEIPDYEIQQMAHDLKPIVSN